MLAKSQRLSRSRFLEFFKTGRRAHTPHFTLVYTPAPTFHGAVVVGKKVYKKAHDRNRLRRRIYGALYRWQQETQASGVFIIVAKPPATSLTQRELAPAVRALLARVA